MTRKKNLSDVQLLNFAYSDSLGPPQSLTSEAQSTKCGQYRPAGLVMISKAHGPNRIEVKTDHGAVATLNSPPLSLSFTQALIYGNPLF